MCNAACIEFAQRVLTPADIAGKSVLEVGSFDMNGSVRSNVEALGPSNYVGVDLDEGPGVDTICDAADLISHFGRESFDLLISTELLEHVRDWRAVIANFKNVLKPDGVLVITTRSKGYGYHGAPFDFWRYELSDMRVIFSDVDIEALENDPQAAGVFIKARKPLTFQENDVAGHPLYSIIKNHHAISIGEVDVQLVKARLIIQRTLSKSLPAPIRRLSKRMLILMGKRIWMTHPNRGD